jgi:hypothetical protein
MGDREWTESENITPANDNRLPAPNQGFAAAREGRRGPENDEDADIAPWQRIDKAVLSIARLIGRRMAREHFEALRAAVANDNVPAAGEAEGQEKQGGGE